MTTKSLALPHNASRRSATQALHVVSMPSTLRPSRAHRIRCKESQGSTYGLTLVSLIRLLSRRGPELDSYAMSSLSPSCSTGNHLGQSSPYGTWMPVAMPRPGSRERGYMSLPLLAAPFGRLRSPVQTTPLLSARPFQQNTSPILPQGVGFDASLTGRGNRMICLTSIWFLFVRQLIAPAS